MVTRLILDNKILANSFLSESNWLKFKTPLKTGKNPHTRGVKLTPASRRRYKIGLPVEGLNLSSGCPVPTTSIFSKDAPKSGKYT